MSTASRAPSSHVAPPVRGVAVADPPGSVSVFVAIAAVALLALAGLVVDGGRALAARAAADAVAEQAARAGAGALDVGALHRGGVLLDPSAAVAAADGSLAAAGWTGTASATSTTVDVTVWTTVPTDLLGIVGIHALSVRVTATATVVHGVSEGA